MRQSKLRWDEVRKGNMNCCYSVGRWMTGTRLKLNNDKTAAVLADRTGRSACDKTSTWQLVIMTLPWKVISKILGSTLMLLCLWWSILATSVEHIYGEAYWPHQLSMSMVKHADHISWACLWWSMLTTSAEHIYGEACWPHQLSISMVKHADHISWAYLWWSILTTSVEHILRSEELVLSAISWQQKPLPSLCVPLLSVSWTSATPCSLTSTVNRCTGCKKVKTMQWRLFFTRADMSMLDSRKFHWLPVKDRIIFKIATLVFLFLWYPATIPVIVSLCIHSFSHASFQFRWKHFLVQDGNLRVWLPVVLCSGSPWLVWNNPPAHIRCCSSLSQFKTSL